MAFKYIFDQVCSKTGVTSPDLNEHQAAWVRDQINVAAKRLYRNKDLPFQLKEIFVLITNNQTVVLPGFVGEVRAMRPQRWDEKWSLNDIRPRYTQNDWPLMWNKARLIGESPIGVELTNAGILTYEYPVGFEDTVSVSSLGETTTSNRIGETLEMSSSSINGTKAYTDIHSLRKDRPTLHNLTVKDINGSIIAHIYADQVESKYLVMDVSAYPTIQDCAGGSFVMEVLYKPALPILYNDEDVFPVSGYDDVLVKMTMQVIAEDAPGEEKRAVLMQEHAKDLVKDIQQDKVGTTDKPMFVDDNPLYDLFPKYGERY